MNPNVSFTNNEIITGIRNRMKIGQNKVITDSDEHVNNNYVNKINSPHQNSNLKGKDFQYLIDSKEPDISNDNQNQNVSNLNNNNQNNNSLTHFNKEEYKKEIEKVFEFSPNLKIELINSVSLEKGLIIKINPFGMVNSIRKENDGFTYFGFVEPNEPNNTMDFIVKPKDDNYEARYVGKHFQIRFNPSDMKYYIQDLGCGFGTFMKLTDEIIIKDNYLINLGNSYIVCIYGTDDFVQIDNLSSDICEKLLNVKIFSGNGNNVQSSFNPNTKSKIFIGRDPECDIVIDDSLLSRIHCTLIYKENLGWVLRDGRYLENEAEGKPSTNGTWLYLMEETQIYDGMIFKGNQNLFSCSYSEIK